MPFLSESAPSVDTVNEISTHLRELAHELNNPLAVIVGFTQLILLDTQCQGKVRADVERVYSEMGRITQIVEKLHAYAVSLQQAGDGMPSSQSIR